MKNHSVLLFVIAVCALNYIVFAQFESRPREEGARIEAASEPPTLGRTRRAFVVTKPDGEVCRLYLEEPGYPELVLCNREAP